MAACSDPPGGKSRAGTPRGANIATVRQISEQEYRRLAVEDGDVQWEVHDGVLREKPGMGAEHNDALTELLSAFGRQLDPARYTVRSNSARTQRSTDSYCIPDVLVVPAELERTRRGRPGRLET